MDETLLFIPPCCVDRKLPKAVGEAPRRTLTFYTHGDVTMEKFFRAIGFLVDDAPNHKKTYTVMVLAMPQILPETAVFLQQCFEREWITHLVLTTSKNAESLMDIHLAEYKDRLLYARSQDVSNVASHMVLYKKDKALILSGPMLEKMSGKTSAYSLQFLPDQANWLNALTWGNPVKNVCFPDVLHQRQQVIKDKREVKDRLLSRFLKASFPPYDDDKEQPLSHGDHHDFGQMG